MKTFKILMLSGLFLLTYVKLMSQQVFVAGGGAFRTELFNRRRKIKLISEKIN